MELIVILLFIVVLIVMIAQKNSIVQHIGKLEQEIHHLREQLSKFSPAPKSKEDQSLTAIPPKTELKKDEYWESGFKVVKEPVPADAQTPPVATVEKVIIPEIIPTPDPVKPARKPIPETVTTLAANKQPQPSFFERHPDLEKFIGENIISKIGIAILVLAIGFFVKFAIDNNWIGPAGRVGIGLLCGGILTALAHVLRKNYQAFSSILVGGGLAVFYFTIALAFHQYQLFGQLTAFAIMLIITVFAVLLSLLYDRQELAIISLIGGFSTPFMVSTGSSNYQALFIYLLILNTGLLVIAYRKAWRLLNLLAFIFTVLIIGGWLVMLGEDTAISTYRNGLLFITAFYILFFLINIAHNIKENKKFIASDFGILLANTSLYFAAGLYLLTAMHETGYRGLFSAMMGIANLLMSYILFRNKKADSNILYLLIGITLTFISLTAPIQLHGSYITLFWASECVLLYWLFQKSAIRIICVSSVIVWIAMLISLVIDWTAIYGNSSVLPVIINKGFITTFYASISCYAMARLTREEQGETEKQVLFLLLKNVFFITGSILLFSSGAFEINHQFISAHPSTGFNILYLLLYTNLFAVVFTQVTVILKLFKNYLYIACILSACILLYLVSVNTVFGIQREMLEKTSQTGHFLAHWITGILMIVIQYRLISIFRFDKIPAVSSNTVATSILCTVAVIFLSVEGLLLADHFFYSAQNPLAQIQTNYIKTGLPILWGFCSFGCMWLGMRYKFKTLRIFSLVLFLITLLKLFLIDIRHIPVAGKIAAFFCLGVLLLVVSFMYQRLKKIIIEDEHKASP